MPPLTEEMHAELRSIERNLRNKLFSCCDSYELEDEGAAFEYVRTYAVIFLIVIMRSIHSIPNIESIGPLPLKRSLSSG